MNIEVLLIEDDQSDVLVIKRALLKAGLQCQWHHADNGEKALALIEAIGRSEISPTLIMLDLNLPRYDGKELLAEIRSTPAAANIPVVVMSGSLNPKDREDVLTGGANMFFHKSIDLAEYMRLGEQVRNLLQPGLAL